MSYDMCMMQWLIAKTDKKNTLMPKEEVVLIFIRSVTKYYFIR